MFENTSTITKILGIATVAGVVATAVSAIVDRRANAECCCCEDEACECACECEALVDPTV